MIPLFDILLGGRPSVGSHTSSPKYDAFVCRKTNTIRYASRGLVMGPMSLLSPPGRNNACANFLLLDYSNGSTNHQTIQNQRV